MIGTYLRRIFKSLFVLTFVMMVFGMSGVSVYAAESSPEACKTDGINITDLFVLSNNYPIVPEGCGSDANGPIALSPAVLGDILIRAYAFIASLAFNLVTPSLIAVGVIWMWNGISDKDAAFAKRWMKNLATSLVLIIFAYLVPFTIRALFFANGNTNLSSFFTFN